MSEIEIKKMLETARRNIKQQYKDANISLLLENISTDEIIKYRQQGECGCVFEKAEELLKRELVFSEIIALSYLYEGFESNSKRLSFIFKNISNENNPYYKANDYSEHNKILKNFLIC